MFWIFGTIVVTLGLGILDAQTQKAKFSCEGRPSGYYADVDSGCQIYHMCDGLGRQFSYTCPNATLFQQRMLICDHWYMVNCSKSVADYNANLRIGQRGMPFVDDSESNPYHRTPRPDLLSHPSASEYDIIYRTGKAIAGNNFNNLVGVESDSKTSVSSTTDEPVYSLPSHWSTEYTRLTTSKPIFKDKSANTANPKKNIQFSSTIKGKPINTATTESPPVNYKSYYKNTTPVFPKTVELTTVASDDIGLLPPLPYQLQNNNKEETVTETTISVPTTVPVNFRSQFKATTPVYPKTVDVTSEEPGDLGILPPITHDSTNETQQPFLNPHFEPPAVGSNPIAVNRTVENEVVPPSVFYQPPKFEPDFNEDTQQKKSGFKALTGDEWEDLRKKFLIPDYEFPLESVARPSYDSELSSFQVNPGPLQVKK